MSHDRDFLDGLVDKVYEFGGGKVREHLGGIYDFLQKKQIESLNQLGQNLNSAGSPSVAKDNGKQAIVNSQPSTSNSQLSTPKDLGNKVQSLLSYAELKERNKTIKKAEKAVEQAEQKIAKLEKDIAEIEAKLATPEGATNTTLFTQYGELKTQLSAAEDEWTDASMELEELKG